MSNSKEIKMETPPVEKGCIRIPYGCELSAALCDDDSRPILRHAYLTQRDDEWWLNATDSYIAVSVRVRAGEGVREGQVAGDILRTVERDSDPHYCPVIRQTDDGWEVASNGSTATYRCALPEGKRYPDLARLGMWDPDQLTEAKRRGIPDAKHDPGGAVLVGMDSELLARAASALGAGQVGVEVHHPRKPVRLVALARMTGDVLPGRAGLLMPVAVLPKG